MLHRNIFLISLAILGVLFPSNLFAAEASLALSPLSGTYTIGNTFTILVTLDTKGDSVNAVEGKIRYLPEDVRVLGVDTMDSPISSWTLPPEYATEPGLISFGGIIPDGFVAQGKTLFTVKFQVLRSGETRLRIASGAAILAEGGGGTNILTDLRGATYRLLNPDDLNEALRDGPISIRSSSHPDPNAWYHTSEIFFEWPRSPDTQLMRFSVDQNPEGAPTGILEGTSEGKKVTLESGVWYGHLSQKDDSGWSPIGHLRLQIDTERPETLTLLEVPRLSPEEPRPTLSIEGTDTRSGISYFEVSIDGERGMRWEDDGNHRLMLPALSPGEHLVMVRAFDRAGNSLAEAISVSVNGLGLPRLDPIPSTLPTGGDIDIRGSVRDGETLRVSIGFESGEPKIEEVAGGPGGTFVHTFIFPQEGTYRLKAQAIDKRGATSEWTPEMVIEVEQYSFLGAIGALGAGANILMSLVLLVVGGMLGIWYVRWSGNSYILRPQMAPSVQAAEDETRGHRSRF